LSNTQPLSKEILDQLFSNARTYSYWLNKDVSSEILHQLYDLTKMGSTSANCLPLRIVFITSKEEKEKLLTCMAPGNIEKTKTAPVTALLAYDEKFWEKLPVTFPHVDARSWFNGTKEIEYVNALRNSTLQAGYFLIAAQALGLNIGAMSGFDEALVNEIFFKDSTWKINFICNLGYGDSSKLQPRLPRLSFNEACKII
jgi:3-hydroxypropanoate dehydrogenase